MAIAHSIFHKNMASQKMTGFKFPRTGRHQACQSVEACLSGRKKQARCRAELQSMRRMPEVRESDRHPLQRHARRAAQQTQRPLRPVRFPLAAALAAYSYHPPPPYDDPVLAAVASHDAGRTRADQVSIPQASAGVRAAGSPRRSLWVERPEGLREMIRPRGSPRHRQFHLKITPLVC